MRPEYLPREAVFEGRRVGVFRVPGEHAPSPAGEEITRSVELDNGAQVNRLSESDTMSVKSL